MNGVHDMGGMQCFGAVNPESDEPLFHAEWESRVLAMTLAMGATGTWNLDESRHARESLPADYYLSAGYYRIWLSALEQLLLNHGLVSTEELTSGQMEEAAREVKRILKAENVPAVLADGAPVTRDPQAPAQFVIGDQVVVKNLHAKTHTRMPGYIRGHQGIVSAVHGAHVFPDSHAHGLGENPQWLYNVEFSPTELWGTSASDSSLAAVHVDCWEPYLSG